MKRAAYLLFGMGATIGSVFDAFHTHSGATSYARPRLFKMAWWTPPLFGVAGLSTGLAYPLVERLLGKPITNEVTPAGVAAGLGAFAGLYAASGFLPTSNFVRLVVLSGGAAILAAKLAPTREAGLLALAAAAIGPTIEMGLVSTGIFKHNEPDFRGVPMWLPALYAAGSIAFGVVGKWVVASIEADDAADSAPPAPH